MIPSYFKIKILAIKKISDEFATLGHKGLNAVLFDNLTPGTIYFSGDGTS